MEDRSFYDTLVSRFLNNTATEEELELFFSLLESGKLQPALEAQLDKHYLLSFPQVRETTKPFFQRWVYVAAAILVVALAASLYFYPGDSTVNEIGPGGNRATLTLADGTKVALDSAQSGIIVSEENIKYQSGKSLSGVIRSEVEGSQEPAELSLSTPRGGQYQIILSDGTKVWLNAASTLKYPSRFSSTDRTVEITGEAYFEIKEDKTKPFKVLSKNQEISVLGTGFNVNAYDAMIKTTLANGAVQILIPHSQFSLLLAPGEQSTFQSNGNLTKTKIDINSVLAWKNGIFDFNHKNLRQVMDELSRWYDIDIVYEGKTPDIEFYGKVYRNNKLSDVLDILKGTMVKFRMEGRKLIIEEGP